METIHILVVEDERIVAMDISQHLRNLGYEVQAQVATGEEALAEVHRHPPNLVLMDIKIEGSLDGIETAEKIRQSHHIPVVYLTAFADIDTLHRAKISEPFGYLLKPFQEKELQTTIEMALYKHQMEVRLREREQWLSTTLRSLGEGVISVDNEGKILLMNQTAEDLTGWPQADAQGLNLNQVLHLKSCNSQAPHDPTTQMSHRDFTAECTLVNRNNQELPIVHNSSPIRDSEDKVAGTVVVFRDVTREKMIEEERNKFQRLESIGILAGGIAHDFNNILTAVVGNIALAKRRVGHQEVIQMLEEAEQAAFRAKNLTLQLLTFSKGGTPIKKLASLQEILKESASFALRGSNVLCEFDIPNDLWTVEVDEGLFNQLLHNLILNADQAMSEGGTIYISGRNVPPEQRDSTLPLEEAAYVEIAIRDEGQGIPAEDLSKIFDPYFTTKSHGSGLGLTTSLSIAMKHDGLITVKSQPGQTIFYIYLPASGEELDPPLSPPISSHVGRGRILIVDDEPLVRKLAGEILHELGYEVEFARNGEEGISLYQKALDEDKRHTLVFLDLTIRGGMGGKAAIQKLREIDPHIKAVVCSGYSNDPLMSQFKEHGFSASLTKPFKLEELNRILNTLCP